MPCFLIGAVLSVYLALGGKPTGEPERMRQILQVDVLHARTTMADQAG